MLDLQEDIKTMYNTITVPLSDKSEIRALNYQGFEAGVSILLNKAYLAGKTEANAELQQLLSNTFTTIED